MEKLLFSIITSCDCIYFPFYRCGKSAPNSNQTAEGNTLAVSRPTEVQRYDKNVKLLEEVCDENVNLSDERSPMSNFSVDVETISF